MNQYDNLMIALVKGMDGDTEAAQIMLDDLIEQNRKRPSIRLEDYQNLSGAFFWGRTRQGWEYWNDINENILAQENDSILDQETV